MLSLQTPLKPQHAEDFLSFVQSSQFTSFKAFSTCSTSLSQPDWTGNQAVRQQQFSDNTTNFHRINDPRSHKSSLQFGPSLSDWKELSLLSSINPLNKPLFYYFSLKGSVHPHVSCFLLQFELMMGKPPLEAAEDAFCLIKARVEWRHQAEAK